MKTKKNKFLDIQKTWDSISNNSMKKFNEDVRGALYRVNVGGFGFNVVYTRAGGIRSGEIHPNNQFDFIIKGKFEIWTIEGEKIVKRRYKENDFFVINKNTPHLFKCLEESIMLEWWDGPFEAEYYQPFRKFVEEQFKKK